MAPIPLTSRDRRALRNAVLAEMDRAESQVAALSRSFDDIVAASELVGTDDEHDPEGNTIAFERAQVSSLLQQARRDFAALRSTLDRVDEIGYGVCERCRTFIGVDRMLALPAATLCIACAR